MPAAAFIGRIGGLAFALGVGVTVFCGQGTAWAAPTDSSGPAKPGASTDSSSSGSAQSSSGGAGTSTAPSGGVGVDKPSTPSAPSSTSTSTAGSPSVRAVKPGEVLSSGGAVTSQGSAADATPAPKPGGQAAKPAPQSGSGSGAAGTKPSAGSGTKPTSTTTSTTSSTATSSARARTVESAAVTNTSVANPASALRSVAVAVAPAVLVAPAVDNVTTAAPSALVSASAINSVPSAAPALLTTALSVLGAGGVPGSPSGSPVTMALLAIGARRETASTLSTQSVGTTAATTEVSAAAVAAQAPTTEFIQWVTGGFVPNTNNTPDRFSIGGTDLGIMWDNGIPDDPSTPINEHQVLIAFGDTFTGSNPPRSGEWRSNVLLRSPDQVLSDGLSVPDPVFGDPYSGSPVLADRTNFSRQVVFGVPGTIGLFGNPQFLGSEVTVLPTAGIAVPGAGPGGATRQYMNVMSVRQWGQAGEWSTNYSAIAYSDNNGETWTVDPNTIRASSIVSMFIGAWGHPYQLGNENFQQGAFVQGVQVDSNGHAVIDPDTGQPESNGYIYSFGTPSGRFGSAYLSRVPENQILNLDAYQYWNGTSWVQGDPSAAVPVLPPGQTPNQFGIIGEVVSYVVNLVADLVGIGIPNGNVGEMSVQYNQYLDQYIVLYTDANNNVVMRTANVPEGPWSAPTTLATSTQYPGLYAPMIQPWSGTGYLLNPDGTQEDPSYLYWNMSQWDPYYNVRLMRTDLKALD
jgi:hypothetical protein